MRLRLSKARNDLPRDGGCPRDSAFLRIRDFLVKVRAVSWTPWFNELYVHIKNLGQTDTTVYRVALQLKRKNVVLHFRPRLEL